MRLRSFLRSPEFPVILAPFVLFAPVLFGKALFWGTPALQFHPWHVFAWETLKSGQLPLWNPLSGMGAPLIANYQSALFYPPNGVYFLLAAIGGEVAMAWGMGVLAAAHLALAGVGMVRLVRELGLGSTAQVVSGLAFGLSGYLVARAHFLSINSAVAWLPWILWAALEMVRVAKVPASSPEFHRVPTAQRNSWEFVGTHGKAFLLLTFFLAMLLLAGHAQTAWYTLVLAGGWIVFWTWNEHPRLSAFTRVLITCAFALLFAVALAAIQLIPTAELLSQSQRSGGAEVDFVMTYSFWPWRFIGLLAPGFFGSPATGDYWGYGNFWEDAVYIGLLPFLLALCTIPFALKKLNSRSPIPNSEFLISSTPLIRFLWLVIAISFLLALGQNTPIFPFLYRNIPTFDLFQAPTRYTIWAVFALALLSGIGAETWTRPVGKKAHGRTMRGISIATSVFLAAFAAGWVAPGIEPSLVRATALAGALGVGAGLLSLYAPHTLRLRKTSAQDATDQQFPHTLRLRETSAQGATDQQSALSTPHSPFSTPHSPFSILHSPLSTLSWHSLLILFLALDLLIAGWGLNPGISLEFYRENTQTQQVRELVGAGRLFLPAADEYDLTFDRYLRFDTFHADFTHFRASLLPNLTLLDGIASANNFDPLRPARVVRWMDALESADPAQQAQMLAMMGVTVIERYAPDTASGVMFEPLEGSRQDNHPEDGYPRFQWFPCAWPAYDGENAWDLLFENPPSLDRNFVLLEGYETGAQGATAQWVCGEADEADIHLLNETPNEIRLQVDAASSGWLLVADTWYPGWTAEVNGEEVPVYGANYLFRAVDIPVGGGEVVMRHRPVGFYVGMVVSLFGWVSFLGMFWRGFPPATQDMSHGQK